MKVSVKLIVAFCLIFIFLHLWGATQPTHYNWGTQSFAYYNYRIGIAFLIGCLAIFYYVLRQRSFTAIENKIQKFNSIPLPFVFLGTAAILIILIFQFPTEGLMLGDSKIILLTTSEIPSSTEVSANFRNQPLVLVLLKTFQDLLEGQGVSGLQEVYKWVDLIASLIFLGFVFFFVHHISFSPMEKILTGLLLMAGGGTQLFFGYIENYAFLYTFTTGYIITGWLALQKKISVLIPVLLLGIIIGLHLSALILLPTIVFFMAATWRENRRMLFVITALCFLSIIIFFTLGDYSLSKLFIRIRDAFRYDFLPLFTPVVGIPYTMISPLHLFEWLNLNLLVLPFGLIPSLILLASPSMKKSNHKNIEFYFLISAAALGLLFTIIINPALGMFRDWDMMSSFFVPLMILTVCLFADKLIGPTRKRLLFLITVLSIIHTTFRIGINANEDRHLQRAEILTNPIFLGRFGQILYYDRLANVFWERQDYQRAKVWYERYIALDSTNPRIISNLSDVYRKLNDEENTFRMLKRSVELGSKNPAVLSNLSIGFFDHGDLKSAIAMGESALTIAPYYRIAHGNLGLFYTNMNNPILAVKHLETALELGMAEPVILKNLGNNYLLLNDYKKAKYYFDSYLSMVPSDTSISRINSKIAGFLKNGSLRKTN